MIDTDRERITKKMLAHVNRHSRLRKENPLKTMGFLIGVMILSMIGVIVFVENAQEIDEFFNARTQRFLLVWTIPLGCGSVCLVLFVRWVRSKF